jgi:hypothetical protein
MFHDANEFDGRAREAERLAFATTDPILRADIEALARIYRDYAEHLRDRPGHEDDADWRNAVNG